MVVGGCGHVAELPYEQRDLPAMIGRVVDGMLNEFAKGIGIRIQSPRRVQLCLRQAMQVACIGVVVVSPSTSQACEIWILARCRCGHKAARLPEVKPSPLAPENVDQRALERTQTGSQVAFALLDTQSSCHLQKASVRPAIVESE